MPSVTLFTRMRLAAALAAGIAGGSFAAAPPIMSLPFVHGNRIFCLRRLESGEAALFVQDGPTGKPRIVLDPTAEQQQTFIAAEDFFVSGNGRYFCYFVKQADPRFQELHILDLKTDRPLRDVLQWTRFTDIAWRGDGFYYARYPEQAPGGSGPLLNHAVYYHRLGTAQSKDVQVYIDLAHPNQTYLFLNSFDEKTLFLHVLDSTTGASGWAEYFREEGKLSAPFTAIEPEITNGRFYLCDVIGHGFLFFTTFKAPNGRVILVDPRHPTEGDWKTVVPEQNDRLVGADMAAGRLFLTYEMADKTTRVVVCKPDGSADADIPLPQPSQVEVQWGRSSDRYVFLSVKQGTGPTNYYRYEVQSRQLILFP